MNTSSEINQQKVDCPATSDWHHLLFGALSICEETSSKSLKPQIVVFETTQGSLTGNCLTTSIQALMACLVHEKWQSFSVGDTL